MFFAAINLRISLIICTLDLNTGVRTAFCVTKNLRIMKTIELTSDEVMGKTPKTMNGKKNGTAPSGPIPSDVESKKPSQPETQPKSLQELQKEFDRLHSLFYRKKRFERALEDLDNYAKRLADREGVDLEAKDFRIILGSGYSNEDFKISNALVISDTIAFLKARIADTIARIEEDIIKGN
jgi:hypothetical protein